MKKVLIIIFGLLIFVELFCCTIGVANGDATSDGRPLIWKTRDRESKPNNRIFYNTELPIKFISVVDSGETYAWMGVNEFGFAILNSASYDLVESRELGNGGFMRYALGNVKSIQEFEDLLISTNETGRSTFANFAVLDSTGMASIFETSATQYWRFDADEFDDNYLIRSNFSVNGGGNSGLDRYNRSQVIINELAAENELDYQHLFKSHIRDFSDENSNQIILPFEDQYELGDPFGFFNSEFSINSYQSVSAAVIRGVLPDEPVELSTLFAILGNPVTSVAVPYFPVGNPPASSFSDSIPPLTIAANKIKERLVYNSRYFDSYILSDEENVGLISQIISFEEDVFEDVEDQLEEWRESEIDASEMLEFQTIIANNVLDFVQNITINDSIIADFDYAKTPDIDGHTIQFIDNSIHAPTNWCWDFDEDGIIDSELQNPIYTFPDNGNYSVTLYAYNSTSSDVIIKENFVVVANLEDQIEVSPSNLFSPYPNPFNPETNITFYLDANSRAELKINNLKGQFVKKLCNENLEKGLHKFIWDGKDEKNKKVSSGIYFVQLLTSEYQFSKKVILLK